MLRFSNHLVLAVLLVFTFHAVFVKNLVIAVEWNCAASTNAGTYTRATDCTIVGNSRVVIASNTQFELTGENKNMDMYIPQYSPITMLPMAKMAAQYTPNSRAQAQKQTL